MKEALASSQTILVFGLCAQVHMLPHWRAQANGRNNKLVLVVFR